MCRQYLRHLLGRFYQEQAHPALRPKVAELEKKLSKLTAENAAHLKSKEGDAELIRRLEAELTALRVSAAEVGRRSRQAEIALRNERDAARADVRAQEEARWGLEERAAQQEGELGILRRDLTDAQAALQEAEAAAAAAERARLSQAAAAKEAQEAAEALQRQQAEKYEAALCSMRSEAAAAGAALCSMRSAAAAACRGWRRLRSEADAARERVQDLTGQLESVRAELDSERERREKEVANLSAECVALREKAEKMEKRAGNRPPRAAKTAASELLRVWLKRL